MPMSTCVSIRPTRCGSASSLRPWAWNVCSPQRHCLKSSVRCPASWRRTATSACSCKASLPTVKSVMPSAYSTVPWMAVMRRPPIRTMISNMQVACSSNPSRTMRTRCPGWALASAAALATNMAAATISCRVTARLGSSSSSATCLRYWPMASRPASHPKAITTEAASDCWPSTSFPSRRCGWARCARIFPTRPGKPRPATC